MELNLTRNKPTPLSTSGELSVEGVFECYTLERPEVQIPLLDSVYDRTDIRIHAGNWPRDTDGCILVGRTLGTDMILSSRLALDPLVQKIQEALASGDTVTLSISDPA